MSLILCKKNRKDVLSRNPMTSNFKLEVVYHYSFHTYRPLRGPMSDDYDSGSPHRSDLCEKCKKLGYNCRDSYY